MILKASSSHSKHFKVSVSLRLARSQTHEFQGRITTRGDLRGLKRRIEQASEEVCSSENESLIANFVRE